MDPYLRKKLSKEKDLAWFRDQFEHTVERKHSLDETIDWFDKNGVEFLGSIPSANFDGPLKKINDMDGDKGTYLKRIFAQISMIFSKAGGEGGLFLVIGKKKKKINLFQALPR